MFFFAPLMNDLNWEHDDWELSLTWSSDQTVAAESWISSSVWLNIPSALVLLADIKKPEVTIFNGSQ